MRFFFDNHLAVKIARGLTEMVEPEHSIVHLRDKFPPNAEDEFWMKALTREENWIIDRTA